MQGIDSIKEAVITYCCASAFWWFLVTLMSFCFSLFVLFLNRGKAIQMLEHPVANLPLGAHNSQCLCCGHDWVMRCQTCRLTGWACSWMTDSQAVWLLASWCLYGWFIHIFFQISHLAFFVTFFQAVWPSATLIRCALYRSCQVIVKKKIPKNLENVT